MAHIFSLRICLSSAQMGKSSVLLRTLAGGSSALERIPVTNASDINGTPVRPTKAARTAGWVHFLTGWCTGLPVMRAVAPDDSVLLAPAGSKLMELL